MAQIGAQALYVIGDIGRMGIYLLRIIAGCFSPPFRFRELLRQIRIIGVNSVPLILFIGLFTGMVLGLQGYYTLRKVGSEGILGLMVAMSLLKELGPVLTALMLTGRAGSAMCAEIGIMKNSEQLDALECMVIDPFRYLISPKFLATLISAPLLTFIFDLVGVFGGYVSGVVMLGVSPGSYFGSIENGVTNPDITLGLYKSMAFGFLIVWICTGRGYFVQIIKNVGYGAKAVSAVTTQAVVLSSIAILLFDFLLTSVLI